jgi:Rrf2 family protein
MRVSAKADYAVRAMIVLAASEAGQPIKGDAIASAQKIPLPFLENILAELRHHGLVHSRRGAEGGYWLAQEPGKISLADVMRAVDGPLATVHGESAEDLDYVGEAVGLRAIWLDLRENVRGVLEKVTLAQVLEGGPEPAPSDSPAAPGLRDS